MYSKKTYWGLTPLIVHGEFPFRLLILLLFVRIMDLIWIRSYYVPDEYWQSLEVAHTRVFGYGSEPTWEWKAGIRSYLYVSIVEGVYRFLAHFGLDTSETLTTVPRALQACLSALADVYFLRWVHERRSGQYSWAFISWITTYFVSYCSTRTLANTFEMDLTIFALYNYPLTPKTNDKLFIILATLSAFIRPTAVILWIPLIAIHILSSPDPWLKIFNSYLPVGVIVGGLSVALDSYMHGSLIITPYRFFEINILKGVATNYGVHDPFWYFYCGLPIVLGFQTLPFYVSSFRLLPRLMSWRFLKTNLECQLLVTILWTLTCLSMVPHKEFRFLLPLLPMIIYISSSTLGRWSTNKDYSLLYLVGVVMIAIYAVAWMFLGQFHQTGSLEAMKYLSNKAKNRTSSDLKIHFLAPCHSFPGFSHLHSDISVRYLTCEPKWDDLEIDPSYEDETQSFYNNTFAWAKAQYPAKESPCSLPSHFVTFSSLNLTNFFNHRNYSVAAKFQHTYPQFLHDPNQGEFVLVYERRGQTCF